jgi:hypothetical protein
MKTSIKLPRKGELVRLIKSLKRDIGDDYRSSEFDSEDSIPSMCVTIGADGEGHDSWSYQTGDNSYSGGAYHYPHWAVVTIHRRSRSSEVADDILSQLHEALACASL